MSMQGPAWMNRLYRRLLDARGACVVAPGHSLSRRGHVLSWQINLLLGNLGKTVFAMEQYAPRQQAGTMKSSPRNMAVSHPADLIELVGAMRRGQVDTLIMLNVNPVYDAPGTLGFGQALDQVTHSVHMGMYYDETGHRATWHIPMSHDLEAWSDARSHDGTASIVQPVITPLYGSCSPHEVLSLLATGQTAS